LTNVYFRIEEAGIKQFTTDTVHFINQFTCITDWFSALLVRNFRTAIPDLIIEMRPPGTRRKMLADACVGAPFNLQSFVDSDSLSKRKMIARSVRETLVWHAKKHGDEQGEDAARNAYCTIEEQGFLWTMWQRTPSPRIRGPKLVASFEMVHSLDGYETVVLFSKPKTRTSVGRVDVVVIPYRPWLVHGLKKFCTWKKNQFLIEIPPSLDWKKSIDTRQFLT